MRRRRFLGVAAGFAAFPALAAAPLRWEGIALGAHARLEIAGPEPLARAALADALAAIRRAEALWTLHAPSELTRLNRDGALPEPSPETAALLALCGRLHRATHGLFDPTVQPLWRALAEGRETGRARDAVGWERVSLKAGVRLGRGQALTLNGIAQGAATDMVVAALRARGLDDALVSVGEQAALGARRLGIVDPAHGLVGALTVSDGAVATSSPRATPLGQGGHVLHPAGGAPVWSTVTVEAETAALADGLSTALCLAGEGQATRIARTEGVRRVIAVDGEGNVRSL